MRVKGIGIYVLCGLVTAIVMAAAVFAPYLRLPQTAIVAQREYPAEAPAMSGASTLSPYDKIQAVGLTIMAHEGYRREKLVGGYIPEDEAATQFSDVIGKLHENLFIDDEVFASLSEGVYSIQAVTEFNYTKDNNSLFTVRVIERTYNTIDLCSKIAISIGIDKETSELIYLYLNFYGLGSDFNFSTAQLARFANLDTLSDNWPDVLNLSATKTGSLTQEAASKNTLRLHATYELEDSSILHYRFGFGYKVTDDHYQVFAEPAVEY